MAKCEVIVLDVRQREQHHRVRPLSELVGALVRVEEEGLHPHMILADYVPHVERQSVPEDLVRTK